MTQPVMQGPEEAEIVIDKRRFPTRTPIVRVLIGPKGSNHKEMEANSRCMIRVVGLDEADRGGMYEDKSQDPRDFEGPLRLLVKNRNGVRPESLDQIRKILDRISQELLEKVQIAPVQGAAIVRFDPSEMPGNMSAPRAVFGRHACNLTKLKLAARGRVYLRESAIEGIYYILLKGPIDGLPAPPQEDVDSFSKCLKKTLANARGEVPAGPQEIIVDPYSFPPGVEVPEELAVVLSRVAEAANAQVSVPGDDPLRIVIEPLDPSGGVSDAQVEAVQSILEANAREAWKRVQDREREREQARYRAAMDAEKARMAQETAQRAVRAAEDRPPEERAPRRQAEDRPPEAIRKGGGK